MAHLNAAGITRLVTKLKERFAALVHTHAAATDITGQLPVANGGTGAATASGARTNLDAAQDDSSGITLASAASNISTLLATTGIASTPSGKTLQGQISTLQDSVGYYVDSGEPFTKSVAPSTYVTFGTLSLSSGVWIIVFNVGWSASFSQGYVLRVTGITPAVYVRAQESGGGGTSLVQIVKLTSKATIYGYIYQSSTATQTTENATLRAVRIS